MNQSMITATNSLRQLQNKIDIISSNVANADTTGYKSKQATFTDLLVQQINNQPVVSKEVGRKTPDGIRIGTGAKLAQTAYNTSQGLLENTGRALDIAFTKENQYLKVLVQTNGMSEVEFTRAGALEVTPVGNHTSMLTDGNGNPVLDEYDNMIMIQGNVKNYAINQNGRLQVTYANGTTGSFNLGVVQMNNPQVLEQDGNNLLKLPQNVNAAQIYTDLSGANRGQISMQQGALEKSNVDLGMEMTDLIKAERSYQLQSRAITISDQMMGLVNSIRS
ncbi:flagellar hook-basal body complex protein FlhP [Weizmannia acidilactici]|jgi:flagellar basal-body rod protein FlgG|uniref:Flagellar hook-basal body complex protein FlhP n=1 Tax=Weizmannia acidilactici TaxID=2607726 RepID=A0A5J4JDR2_9BACI|nr:flagellar hook-basal body protein [Weizmannia acidilactici]GER66395.1 flagellar hook-basal body complex protein FlhP [Weizmannia acidilactici]GER69459.1 flagellar hook-basal body complex protein FlhP [Weizmannia acidilactici]GER72996.1 flagellar hook-basal body complex protein FlhP [Weizmannia acidilactici]